MATYEPHRREFGRFMKSPQIHDIVRKRARAGAKYLHSIAPEDEGHYKASINVQSGWSITGDRPAAFIVVDDESAAPNEFGNKHVKRPPKPLQKTIAFIERGE